MHEPVQPESIKACASMPSELGGIKVMSASNCRPALDLMITSSSVDVTPVVSEPFLKSSVETIFASMGGGTCDDLYFKDDGNETSDFAPDVLASTTGAREKTHSQLSLPTLLALHELQPQPRSRRS